MYLKKVIIDTVTRSKTFSAKFLGTFSNAKLPSQLQAAEATAMNENNVIDYTTDSVGLRGILQAVPSRSTVDIDKEVEVKSSFEAMALALRHDAIIEVVSALFHDELSYDLDELELSFPKLLEAKSAAVGRTKYVIEEFPSDFTNPSFDLERLQRRLKEAMRQQNELKVVEIQRSIEFIRNNSDGASSVLIPPSTFPDKDVNKHASQVFDSSSSQAPDTEIMTIYDIPIPSDGQEGG